MGRNFKSKGFTLVEILVVVVILALLVLIAVPLIGRVVNTARANAMEINIKTMESSAKRYTIVSDDYNQVSEKVFIIPLKKLIEEDQISKIFSPYNKNIECDGAVVVNKESAEYSYEGHLNCGGHVSGNIISIYQELDGEVERQSIVALNSNTSLLPETNGTAILNILTDLNLDIIDSMDPENNVVTGNVIVNNGTSITGDGTTSQINGSTYEVIADIVVKDENGNTIYKGQEMVSIDETEPTIEEPTQLVSDVTDTTPGALAGTGTSANPYLIESIEDLVFISQTTNAGNSYSGKYFSLTTSLDFDYNGSYSNSSATNYGDINGNSIEEGLKTELTTGKGWKPIGNSTTFFNGNLIGNRNTIFNLYINRTDEDYIGLLGYLSGNVSNLKLKDINISGKNYVGGITGYNYFSSIKNCEVTGSINGTDSVGLVIGRINGSSNILYITASGNVTGSNYVGGIVGYMYFSTYFRGINNGGAIVATGTNFGRILGNTSSTDAEFISAFANDDITVNGAAVSNLTTYHKDGADITSFEDINNINDLESIYDTYIGGDNDSDGYYWDYDGSGNLVERNINDYPLTFDLAGSGTSVDPYIIEDYNDLRMASQKNNKYYKLNNDINLSGKNFYMLGSFANSFTGEIDGNGKTISNLSLETDFSSNVGFIGYNKGIITGLNLTSLNVSGINRVGGIAGYNENAISNLNVSGNVSGISNVGIGIGRNYALNKDVTSIIVDGNVNGADYVGGLAGYSYAAKIIGIYKGGTVVGGGTRVFRAVGDKYTSGTINAKALSTITVNGSPVTSTSITSKAGTDITSADLLSSSTYTTIGFNFTDETLKYIWYIEGGIAKFRRGSSS